jgi:hypothetical protein
MRWTGAAACATGFVSRNQPSRPSSWLTISHTRRERTVAKTSIAEPVRWRIGQLGNPGLATCPIFLPGLRLTGSVLAEYSHPSGRTRIYWSLMRLGAAVLERHSPPTIPSLISAVYYDTYLTDEPDEAFRLMNVIGSGVDLTREVGRPAPRPPLDIAPQRHARAEGGLESRGPRRRRELPGSQRQSRMVRFRGSRRAYNQFVMAPVPPGTDRS